jgi:hypothetical protein
MMCAQNLRTVGMFFMPRIYPDPFPLDFSHTYSEDERLRREDEASHLAPRHRYKLKKSAYIRLIRIICGFLPPPTFNSSRAFQCSMRPPRHRRCESCPANEDVGWSRMG